MTTIRTASGATKELPDRLAVERVAGLDADGRIVVDDFGARQAPVPPPEEYTFRSAPFLFGLTLCCNASDKGMEDGVGCRGCHGLPGEVVNGKEADAGAYLYREADGSFPGLDPIVE